MKNISNEYVTLLAKCIRPNWKTRITVGAALIDMRNIINDGNIAKPYLAHRIPDITIDDMECMINISEDVVTICTHVCLNLSENLYKSYIEITGDRRYEVQLSCVYIASCVFSGSNNVLPIILKIMDRPRLRKNVIRILSDVPIITVL
jgi:hypothetical protein